jgi:hypothetical protein
MICFGIDGIGNINELYRVNVKWDKLYENFKSFAQKSDSWQKEIQFLLWNETTDQIIPIIELAQEYECGRLYLRKPYTHGKFTEVFDMKGRSTHFLTELKDSSANFLIDTIWELKDLPELKQKVKNANIPIFSLRVSDLLIKPKIKFSEKKYEIKDIKLSEETNNKCIKQTCYSKNRNNFEDLTKSLYNIYITHNKLLMPCCMIPPYISNSITHSSGTENNDQIEILNKMKTIGFNEFSLKDKTLKEVINSGVLRKFVYDDLENNKSFGLCKMHCGKSI